MRAPVPLDPFHPSGRSVCRPPVQIMDGSTVPDWLAVTSRLRTISAMSAIMQQSREAAPIIELGGAGVAMAGGFLHIFELGAVSSAVVMKVARIECAEYDQA